MTAAGLRLWEFEVGVTERSAADDALGELLQTDLETENVSTCRIEVGHQVQEETLTRLPPRVRVGREETDGRTDVGTRAAANPKQFPERALDVE